MRDVLWVSECICSQPFGTSPVFHPALGTCNMYTPIPLLHRVCGCGDVRAQINCTVCYCCRFVQEYKEQANLIWLPDQICTRVSDPVLKSVSISQLVFLSFLSYFSCRSINFQLQSLRLTSVSTLQYFCSLCFHRYQSNYKTQVYGNGK